MSDDDPPKLIPITGGNNPSLTAEAVRQMKKNLPHFKEFITILAEQKWTYYNELVNQGFTKEEALHLTISAPF